MIAYDAILHFEVNSTNTIYCHTSVVYWEQHLSNLSLGLASVSIYAQNSFKAEQSKAIFHSSHYIVLFVW